MAVQVLSYTVTLFPNAGSYGGRDPQARALWTESYDSDREAQMRAIVVTPDGYNSQLGITLTDGVRTWNEPTRTIWR